MTSENITQRGKNICLRPKLGLNIPAPVQTTRVGGPYTLATWHHLHSQSRGITAA
jgi:hypothetical protein